MWALKLLLFFPIAYAAILLTVFLAQDRLLFPAGMVAKDVAVPLTAERLIMRSESGEQLHGIHIPPSREEGERLLVLAFGGNAWNAEAAAEYLHDLYPFADVVAFHYRGYPPSTGKASAAALLADAPLIHDEAKAVFRPSRIVAIGFSIGSGVAARLARERELSGLVLVTPFDSLTEVARGHYPWLPVRWLFRHEMPAADDLRDVRTRAAIIAAEHDTIIPPERTEGLRKAVPNLVLDRTVPDVGHNDIYHHPAFRDAMTDALDAMKAPALPAPS